MPEGISRVHHYSDSLKKQNMEEIWTEEAQLKFSEVNKTSLGPRLKFIHITSRQMIWLHSAMSEKF